MSGAGLGSLTCFQGCALLGHLAIDPNKPQQFVTAGAISAICKAMKEFPIDEQVQAMGCGLPLEGCLTLLVLVRCGAFWNLAINEEVEASLHGSKYGVLEITIRALEQHRMSEAVATRGLGLLWNLAGTEEHKQTVLVSGGLQSTLLLLKAHLQQFGSQKVVASGCALLWHLTRDSGMVTLPSCM